MTEFLYVSIVGFGILAIGMHLMTLIKRRRRFRHHRPNGYLPSASRSISLRSEIKDGTFSEDDERWLNDLH